MNPPGGPHIIFEKLEQVGLRPTGDFDPNSYIDRCKRYLFPQQVRESGDVKFDTLLLIRLSHQKRNEELLQGEKRNTDSVNWWVDITLDSLYPIGEQKTKK